MITDAVVFLGPTLLAGDARQVLQARYLPPAAQGDVLRVVSDNPVAIAIVDGLFENVPAVWHKEILWAMAQGIPVFGASSMGALRAAELSAFGMTGVGRVFEQFRSGALDADDEVAIAHGGAEDGYRALSDAMVNIRATLAAAASAQVITEATRLALERLAKTTFYADRTYPRLLHNAQQAQVAETELSALGAWLPAGRIDQKRLDALSLLEHLNERIVAGLPRIRPTFRFEHTDSWEATSRR